ncbi:unnamed protein product [Cuscuta campestris]|uniref:Uncharacterized protein n=1 Tax=Cuscuta campestris TaxID=132261 RepID=A0A484MLZ4_9ASTE|nr:unnamed protein product [Cuscuta campestris]
MNFNLDSDFSKMSSFKIDMSDLDISSPCKKSENTKGKPKESSGGDNKGMSGGFTFNFDFKELDSFSLQSSPRKEDHSKKDQEIGSFSGASAQPGSGLITEDGDALVAGSPQKHYVPEKPVTSRAVSLVDSGLTPDTIGKNFSLECSGNSHDASISSTTVTHESELLHTRTSTNTPKTVFQLEKGISPEPVAQEAIEDSHHSSGHESSNNAHSSLLGDVGSMETKTSSSDVENDLENIVDLDSNGEKAMHEGVPGHHNHASQETDQEGGKFESDKDLSVSTIEGNSTHSEHTNIASAKKNDHFTKLTEQIEEPISRTLKSLSSSGSAVHNLVKGKGECSAIQSKFFKPSIEIAAQKQMSLIQTKFLDVANKRIGTSQPNQSVDGMVHIGQDEENGTIAGITLPGSKPLPKISTPQTGCQESSKGLSAKTLHVKPLSLSQQSKSMLQNSRNPRVLESSVLSSTSKNTLADSNKICLIKGGTQILGLSSPKHSKNLGASLSVSQSLLLKDGKTSRNPDQNTGLKVIAQAKVTDSITPTTQKPNTTPLKRKTPETTAETSTASPFKRPSESPNGNRELSAIPERIVTTQDNRSEVQATSIKRVECNASQASVFDISQGVNKKELGALQTLEDDENVDKAEAYTKELEDICNMLRKKHEEAKELLVRCIVNNNKLLMLNHPIHEEKISFFLPLFASCFCFYFIFT